MQRTWPIAILALLVSCHHQPAVDPLDLAGCQSCGIKCKRIKGVLPDFLLDHELCTSIYDVERNPKWEMVRYERDGLIYVATIRDSSRSRAEVFYQTAGGSQRLIPDQERAAAVPTEIVEYLARLGVSKLDFEPSLDGYSF